MKAKSIGRRVEGGGRRAAEALTSHVSASDSKERRADATEILTSRLSAFAVRVIKMANSFPKGPAANVIAHQIIRSACSIGANYREAQRARTRNEFASKASIALQECDESGWWLRIIGESDMLPANRLAELIAENHELTSIFTAITRSSKRPALFPPPSALFPPPL